MVKFLRKQIGIPTEMLAVQLKAQTFIEANEEVSKEVRLKIIEVLNSAKNLEGIDEDKKGIIQVSYLSTLLAMILKDSGTPREVQKKILTYVENALEMS